MQIVETFLLASQGILVELAQWDRFRKFILFFKVSQRASKASLVKKQGLLAVCECGSMIGTSQL